MEGYYDSYLDGVLLILFGIFNFEEKCIDYVIEILKFSLLILKYDLNVLLVGFDIIFDEDELFVLIVFFSFCIMVGIGFVMFGIGVWSLWLCVCGCLYELGLFYCVVLIMGLSGFVVVLVGWIMIEVGC